MNRYSLVPALAVMIAACASAAPRAPAPAPARTLALVIDSVLATPPLERAHWGVFLHDARTGRVLYAAEPERLFIPASNMKLVGSAVALAELGPDYRYRTVLTASGTPGDTAVAELRVHGSGDPTLSARFHGTSFAALDSVAAAVAAAGVRRAAELVIDASRFDSVRVHPVWEVSDLPWWYAAPVAAFAIDEGVFHIVLLAGPAVGAPGRAEVSGGDELQPLVARVTTDTAGAGVTRAVDFIQRRDTVFLTATVGLGAAPDTSRLAVTDPVGYAARALAAALERHGVVIEHGVRVVFDTAQARHERAAAPRREVAALLSPPLADIVAAIQRPSQNWIAEMLVKTLGAERGEHGTWAAGNAVIERYLAEDAGLDEGGFLLRDGSGLAAQNLLAPRAVVRLLDHARTQPWGDAFRAALPAPGMTGSTLATRLAGLETSVRAKTGTISNVGALSGYIVTDAGRELTFSILVNGTGRPSADVRAGIDRIIEAIVRDAGGGTW